MQQNIKQALNHHVNVHHRKSESFKCDECDTSFTAKVNLDNHKKYVHSSEKRIKCSFCDKRFKQKRDLNFHLDNIHQIDRNDHYMNTWNDTGKKPRFKCGLCEKTYKYKKDLTTHKKRNHTDNITEQNDQQNWWAQMRGMWIKLWKRKVFNEQKLNKHEENFLNCRVNSIIILSNFHH